MFNFTRANNLLHLSTGDTGLFQPTFTSVSYHLRNHRRLFFNFLWRLPWFVFSLEKYFLSFSSFWPVFFHFPSFRLSDRHFGKICSLLGENSYVDHYIPKQYFFFLFFWSRSYTRISITVHCFYSLIIYLIFLSLFLHTYT